MTCLCIQKIVHVDTLGWAGYPDTVEIFVRLMRFHKSVDVYISMIWQHSASVCGTACEALLV